MGDKKGNMFIVRTSSTSYDYIFISSLHKGTITCINPNYHKNFKNYIILATGSYDKTIKISKISNYDEYQFRM